MLGTSPTLLCLPYDSRYDRSRIRRMGRAQRNPSMQHSWVMGFASLYPSYGPMAYAARFADTMPHTAIAAIKSEISTL